MSEVNFFFEQNQSPVVKQDVCASYLVEIMKEQKEQKKQLICSASEEERSGNSPTATAVRPLSGSADIGGSREKRSKHT